MYWVSPAMKFTIKSSQQNCIIVAWPIATAQIAGCAAAGVEFRLLVCAFVTSHTTSGGPNISDKHMWPGIKVEFKTEQPPAIHSSSFRSSTTPSPWRDPGITTDGTTLVGVVDANHLTGFRLLVEEFLFFGMRDRSLSGLLLNNAPISFRQYRSRHR